MVKKLQAVKLYTTLHCKEPPDCPDSPDTQICQSPPTHPHTLSYSPHYILQHLFLSYEIEIGDGPGPELDNLNNLFQKLWLTLLLTL